MRTFTIDGSIYHEEKANFKKLLKTLNLKWAGTWGNAIWKGPSCTITAIYERDEETDTTITATISITETCSPKIATYLLDDLLGIETTLPPSQPYDQELRLYDMVYVEPSNKLLSMYRYPAPLISKYHAKWKLARNKYITDLRTRYKV